MKKTAPWLDHYPKDVDWHMPIPAKPLFSILEESSARFPAQPCLEFLGKTWSYKQTQEAVDSLALNLQRLGVGKGSRVGLLMPNHPYFVIGFYAILRAGGTVVNFNPLSAPEEIRFQAEDAQLDIMLTVNLDLCYNKVSSCLHLLRYLIVGDFAAAMSGVSRLLFKLTRRKAITRIPRDSRHMRLEPLIENHSEPLNTVIFPDNDIAVLQYTGGTTGVPKAAELTHAALYANTMQCGLWCASTLHPGKEKMLAVLPLFHVFAMTAAMNLGLFRGMEIILLPRFDLARLLKTIASQKPTILPGVPTLFAAIANHPEVKDFDLSSIKLCISGGAGLPLKVREDFEAITGCRLVEGYGLTESSPVASVNPLDGKDREGSIGLPLPATNMAICDVEDPYKFLPVGEVGEICISGPQLMHGYWQKPDETRKVFVERPDGRWLRTGDMGRMDEDGYFYVVDRLKDMIISRGYNIYPRHIEEAIYKHEAVLEAAVIGVPDDALGEKVRAYVVLKPEQKLSAEKLRGFLEPQIAAYAMPKEIEFCAELPKTMIGKVLKRALRN